MKYKYIVKTFLKDIIFIAQYDTVIESTNAKWTIGRNLNDVLNHYKKYEIKKEVCLS